MGRKREDGGGSPGDGAGSTEVGPGTRGRARRTETGQEHERGPGSAGRPPIRTAERPAPLPRQNVVPVRRSYASMYRSRVAATTSAGSSGGGASDARSQPEAGDVSQSRTYCLSRLGCTTPSL